MRQYKFRGLTKSGEWAYGLLLKHKVLGTVIQVEDEKNLLLTTLEVLPETVGQWTGLYDETGQEIYIGDKFQFKIGEYVDAIIIEWDERGCGISYHSLFQHGHSGKVIGSIHTHPQLTKQKV